MNTERKRKLGRTVLVALAVAGVAQACGKDTAPVDAPTIGSGTGGDSGTGGSGRGGTGATSGTDNPGGENPGGSGGTSGTSGAGNSGGSGARGGTPGTGGTGNGADGGSGNEGGAPPDGCVRNPTEPEDFLVRCTNSRCAPFDNFARIDGYSGTLPDL